MTGQNFHVRWIFENIAGKNGREVRIKDDVTVREGNCVSPPMFEDYSRNSEYCQGRSNLKKMILFRSTMNVVHDSMIHEELFAMEQSQVCCLASME